MRDQLAWLELNALYFRSSSTRHVFLFEKREDSDMRTLAALFLSFFWLAGFAVAEPVPAHAIDPEATTHAPWKVGATVYEYDMSVYMPIDSTSYRIERRFLGITTGGHILVQDFYADIRLNGEPAKYSDPVAMVDRRAVMSFDWHRDFLYPDIFDGPFKLWFANGQPLAQGESANRQMQGAWIRWTPNGSMELEANYVDDKPHGLWIQWGAFGHMELQGNLVNGEQDGKWTYWDEQGNKTAEVVFDRGRAVTRTVFEH